MLQRIELEHDVEAAVVEEGEAFLEVELDDVDAPLLAGEHVGVGDLDAVAAAAAVLAQVHEEVAVAAAEVEHARASWHQLRDDLQVLSVAHGSVRCRLSNPARRKPW